VTTYTKYKKGLKVKVHHRKKEVVKNTYIRMRVTEDRKKEIKKYCKDNNITISTLLEMGINCIIGK
jgi:hypothetical protein